MTIRVARSRSAPSQPDIVTLPINKIDVSVAEESGGPKVDYAAVVKRYADKVTNRKSAIRAKCIECSCGQLSEVRDCPVTGCALYPYRMGEDPNNKKTAARLAKESGQGDDDGEE